MDVFFVISGYLITGKLMREAERTGSVSLMAFYRGRIRRLLPAATLVLLFVSVAALFLLPRARWEGTAIEIAASALYLENWRLAWLSIDYLGSRNAPSPVQHYWSLSIEEQFYLVWPVLVIACASSASRLKISARSATVGVLLLVTAISFALSIATTESRPEQAYFLTQTRMWELGLGGIVALVRLPNFRNWSAEALRASGLVAILTAGLLFNSATPFPGYLALLPTLGCAAIIAAGDAPNSFVLRPLNSRMAQYLGDISYSIYLWHWPLVVFLTVYIGGPPTLRAGLAAIAATLILAAATKRFVEDRFRHAPPDHASSSWRVVLGGVASIVGCLAASAGLAGMDQYRANVPVVDMTKYPGPAAMLDDEPVPTVDLYLPVSLASWDDLPEVYPTGCHRPVEAGDLKACHYGATKPDNERVFLIGDSHAANWASAMKWIAETHDWSVETHTKSGCSLILDMQSFGTQPYNECKAWTEKLLQRIQEARPSVIVLSMSSGVHLHNPPPGRTITDAIHAAWNAASENTDNLFIVADTPLLPIRPAECLAVDPECVVAVEDLVTPLDPMIAAFAEWDGSATWIDLNDALCSATVCPMAIGNVVVWRDTDHLTSTYSSMLGPYLYERIQQGMQ